MFKLKGKEETQKKVKAIQLQFTEYIVTNNDYSESFYSSSS